MPIAQLPTEPPDFIFSLQAGTRVRLLCKTTASGKIYLPQNRDDRARCVPEPVQKLVIPYEIEGVFEAIQYGAYDYVVLTATRKGASVEMVNGHYKLVRDGQSRNCVMHVPIGAIVKQLKSK